MNTSQCKDLILDDVVGIKIYKSSDCAISIPPYVVLQSIVETDGMFPTPLFSAMTDGSGDVEMSEVPTIKVTNARQGAGNIYTHDLQIPVFIGRTTAEKLVNTLQGIDFHVACIHADGSLDFSYALPNTSVCDIETNISSNQSVMLKLKVQSMSNLIRVTSGD